MTERSDTDTTTSGDVIAGAGGWLFALGMVTMVLFPFALPALVLAGAALVPLLLAGVVGVVVAGVVAVPVLAIRALRRRRGAVGAPAAARVRAS